MSLFPVPPKAERRHPAKAKVPPAASVARCRRRGEPAALTERHLARADLRLATTVTTVTTVTTRRSLCDPSPNGKDTVRTRRCYGSSTVVAAASRAAETADPATIHRQHRGSRVRLPGADNHQMF
jgi:hypothetical protein